MVARSGVRFTVDDIWETPDDGNRYEVIDGEPYVTPPPIWEHQLIVSNLLFLIRQHIQPHGLGKVVPAPVGVVLDDESGVQPDLVYVSRERLGIIAERGVEGAPDLVAEVPSPSTRARDRGIKMKRYATAAIPHYWIVDPRARTLESYKLGGQGYDEVGSYGSGATFRPELFPGLEIPIDSLFS
jgi:Uma2 family endonuclease